MTRPAIDRAEVRRIARLAHLDLDEATIAAFADQLATILDYIAVLDELDLESVPPTSHTLADGAPLRDDVVQPSLSTEQALANAPDPDDDQFRVPRVPGR